MLIKKLELENFRQYIGNQTIEFSTDCEKNVTVLIGVNTSGKTTLEFKTSRCFLRVSVDKGLKPSLLKPDAEISLNTYFEDPQEYSPCIYL